MALNCSAFQDQLLESELFGHEKGAFTDAKESRAGLFEMARGGTLVLDEIAEMKPGLQAKLLRVTEGGRFRRVGGTREIRSDVRLVASTNRDLPAMIREGGFRQDLYFRLNVFEIRVPPLRARGDDTTLLARAFLARFAAALRKPEPVLTDRAAGTLRSYRWPGNVRELRNVMERAMIFTETGEVDREHLPGELAASAFIERQVTTSSDAMPSLAEIERLYIAHILERTGGNISDAARLLGIARNTLKAKLRTTQDA